MQDWWDTLSSFEKIFWYISVPFSVIFFIQMLITFAGIGSGKSDVATDLHDVTSGNHSREDVPATKGFKYFGFFTLRNFIAFFTVLGWTGILFIHSGLKYSLTIVLSAAAGITAMLLLSTLVYLLGGKKPAHR